MRAATTTAARKRELKESLWLALVPLGMAFVLGSLLFPRRAMPDGVPLPLPDAGGLARSTAADHVLAEDARRDRLPSTVRALGSALREFHLLEAGGMADANQVARARAGLDAAVRPALAEGDEAMLRLRAVQLESFLHEIDRFEQTNVQSAELVAVAGNFVGSMETEGWYDGRGLAGSEGAFRAMFKEMRNALLGLSGRPAFAVPLDEERALYALYLSRPHAAPAMRVGVAAARRGARDAAHCEALAQAERTAIETWRAERIRRLAAVDPLYPAAYALGIADLRRGDYARATDDFEAWLRDHPTGPFVLRARTYLRTAASLAGVD